MPAPTNTQFSLAVHVLTLLGSESPELVSSEFLAGSAGTSPEHVRRVLAPLRRAGMVRSKPGPSGGWQLDGAACETTLGAVWRAVHGDEGVLGVHAAAPECTVGQRIQSELEEIERRAVEALVAELDQVTLGQLVEETSGVTLSGRI
ncbi:Rrf2 family transcriptional regulator [Solirubrobacter soli]|uniref:Rrf2 family transcriptional regulator n=1 Tax=Solirubrobacter soli TaxID=363832 RepID=UPI00041B51C6|nr:Rrf2 family transcriptional regulator [Solirubrobacter soli]